MAKSEFQKRKNELNHGEITIPHHFWPGEIPIFHG
jgi:hypothetical protein